jgi:hypothetical protein
MFPATKLARLVESFCFQNDQALVAMHVTMLSPMLETEIRRDRELKHTAVVVVNAATLMRRMLVIARSPFCQGVEKRLHPL